MTAEKEVWQNNGNGEIWVNTTNSRGELVQSVVRPKTKIFISTADRIINQELTVDDNLDFFKNGMLTPVKLLEDAEDYEELASNPNHLSESDMKALFNLKVADFKKRIADISNLTTLQRILDLAEQEDTGAGVSQVKALTARVEALSAPVSAVTQTPLDELESI